MSGFTRKDVEAVLASGLFDAAWYLENYPDVKMVGMDPAEHYLRIGARLGRNPSLNFDAAYYMATNEDVAAAAVNPLLHYLNHGMNEGRQAYPVERAPIVSSGTVCDPHVRVDRRPTVNWVMNADNRDWAYGNNARQLAEHLPMFRHIFDDDSRQADIALYFDIKIFKMRGVLGRKNVLRVGGPRPVALSYGNDYEVLRADIQIFDEVIVLNRQLYDLFSPLHRSVHLVPNALDLNLWRPEGEKADSARNRFVVGFAGNLATRKERELKGFDLVEEACERLGLELLYLSKGEKQIARDDMRSQFYSQIDCLVHPVAEGKEGCSNVIMEALTVGVPVVTTRYAGFHAENVPDGSGILYCSRDVGGIAGKIEMLRADPVFRDKMSRLARDFAVRMHDIDVVAQRYREIFAPLVRPEKALRISFVPFWEPIHEFASARLRCEGPTRLLAGSTAFSAQLRLAPDTDVAFVSQLASDKTYKQLIERPDIFVVYDVCDRYFADDRQIGGVCAKERFFQMAERADVLVASTVALKREMEGLGLGKAVVHIPDGIDYRESCDPTAVAAGGNFVWFGNPGRGNFDSSRWMIDHVLKNTESGLKIISNRRHFARLARENPSQQFAEYLNVCVDWQFDTFVSELKSCSICLLSHSPDERTKSPNRLVTAVANGVPVIVSDAPSCEEILRAAGMDYAIVKDETSLSTAIERLSNPEERRRYLEKVQGEVQARFGDNAVRKYYEDFLDQHVWGRSAPQKEPLRVLFVSHNLSGGEGAPTSLMQTAIGLRSVYGIEPVVYAVLSGSLKAEYEKNGIPVVIADFEARSRLVTKTLSRAYPEAKRDFHKLVDEHRIDVVVANTAKCLCFVDMANEIGIPAFSIVRESSDEHISLDFSRGEFREASRRALESGSPVVFVSGQTRSRWLQARDLAETVLIPNGIEVSAFGDALRSGPATLRRELGLPAEDILLLSVGTINERKAQLDIVEAYALLPRDLQRKSRLILVGAKTSLYLDRVKRRIEELPAEIGERISLVPETDAVASWYGAADVFVFASTNESYPRVIVEAMYFGLPIVSSAVFGTEEQIRHGESGLLFAPGDVKGLAGLLEKVLSDADARAMLAAGSEKRFFELTSYQEMLHRYYVLMQRMLASNSCNSLKSADNA